MHAHDQHKTLGQYWISKNENCREMYSLYQQNKKAKNATINTKDRLDASSTQRTLLDQGVRSRFATSGQYLGGIFKNVLDDLSKCLTKFWYKL